MLLLFSLFVTLLFRTAIANPVSPAGANVVTSTPSLANADAEVDCRSLSSYNGTERCFSDDDCNGLNLCAKRSTRSGLCIPSALVRREKWLCLNQISGKIEKTRPYDCQKCYSDYYCPSNTRCHILWPPYSFDGEGYCGVKDVSRQLSASKNETDYLLKELEKTTTVLFNVSTAGDEDTPVERKAEGFWDDFSCWLGCAFWGDKKHCWCMGAALPPTDFHDGGWEPILTWPGS